MKLNLRKVLAVVMTVVAAFSVSAQNLYIFGSFNGWNPQESIEMWNDNGVYTLCTISVRAEPTFERLRYSFGGDRPSQTAHLTMSHDQIHGRWLENQQYKSGIPRTTPPELTPGLPSLPPILYMHYRSSILNCSKASWGLSV